MDQLRGYRVGLNSRIPVFESRTQLLSMEYEKN